MSEKKPIKLAILWHMHQPNYQEPNSKYMVMPWVRLHAVKDYLDMPLIASKYENIKTTFNLVPSLLDQLDLYLNQGSDPHLDLSRINAEHLNDSQKKEILKTFFSANFPTMIEPYTRYNQLYKKAKNRDQIDLLPALFSSEEIRDLQVWSNLCWIDPVFHQEEPIKSLLDKGRHYSEADKHALLEWQVELIGKISQTFKRLYNEQIIDISFTPYFHPILPLLCDSNIAKEAMPHIKLPQKQFIHPEDAKYQIVASMDKFQSMFGHQLNGMWPSEGSVSEEVAQLITEAGIKWIATDEEILYNSIRKSGQSTSHPELPFVYEYGKGLKIFFRNHALSDKIGFVYSGWDADKAVSDFISNLKKIRNTHLKNIDDCVVSVILDGENCWEYFPKDGHDFLDELYRSLSRDNEIELVTMTEAAEKNKPKKLKSLFAGSWINHNFRIWIGHTEDNQAWDLLMMTRDRLVQFEKENPEFDKHLREKAWRQIYIAEGSDWCWWYGDEHRGDHNEQFDLIFRKHLIAVYEILQIETPSVMLIPIFKSETDYKMQIPDALISPSIDGRVTHFYEWSGAGIYDCEIAGDSMHRVDRYASKLLYGYDRDHFYIRLDFINKKMVESIREALLEIRISKPFEKVFKLDLKKRNLKTSEDGYCYVYNEIFEIAFERSFLFENGFGEFEFNLKLMDGDNILELLPLNNSISLNLPERNKELFWPL